MNKLKFDGLSQEDMISLSSLMPTVKIKTECPSISFRFESLKMLFYRFQDSEKSNKEKSTRFITQKRTLILLILCSSCI